MRAFLFLFLLTSTALSQSPRGFSPVELARRGNNSVAASGFTYYSAYFDGANDYLARGANFTGAVDTNRVTVSFWMYVTNYPADQEFIVWSGSLNNGIHILVDSAGTMTIKVGGVDGIISPDATTSVPLNGWVNYLYSYSDSFGWKLYTNDVSANSSATVYGRAYDATVGGFDMGHRAAGDIYYFKGWLCEFFYTTESLDLSTSGNRRKFITAGLKPENLGSDGSTPFGAAPLLYLHNQVPNWESNLGGGGGLTETGSLEDGGSNKP